VVLSKPQNQAGDRERRQTEQQRLMRADKFRKWRTRSITIRWSLASAHRR
jgi:hypothetical protein